MEPAMEPLMENSGMTIMPITPQSMELMPTEMAMFVRTSMPIRSATSLSCDTQVSALPVFVLVKNRRCTIRRTVDKMMI